MSFITKTFIAGLELLFLPASGIWSIMGLSLLVALTALLLALLVGTPLATLVALKNFPIKKSMSALIQGSMGFPPILIGLFISLLLWPKGGPFAFLGLLYTPLALIITQTLIVLPIIMGFTITSIQQLDPQLLLQFKALGASPKQLFRLILWEIRFPLTGATLVGGGRILSEVGATLMTGGNIPNHTEVIATAITLETTQGNLELAVALGLALLFVTITLAVLLALIRRRGKNHEYSY